MFGFDYLVEFRDERVVENLSYFQLLSDNLHHTVLFYLSFVEQFTDEILALVTGQYN